MSRELAYTRDAIQSLLEQKDRMALELWHKGLSKIQIASRLKMSHHHVHALLEEFDLLHRPCPQLSYVYFMRVRRYIKIGVTTNVDTRLSSIQSSCPYPVELLGIHAGDYRIERQLHKQFAQSHHAGEWFHTTPKLLAEIRRLCDGNVRLREYGP